MQSVISKQPMVALQSAITFLRLCLVKWKQVVCSSVFLVSAGLAGILCFSTAASADGSKYYSVFEILFFKFGRGETEFQSLGYTEILREGLGTYVIMFFPIFAALPAVLNHCLEYRTEMIRFKLVRKPYRWNLFSDCFGLLMGAGSVAVTGYLFYAALIRLLFPKGQADRAFLVYFCVKLACILLFGIVSVIPVLWILPFGKNEYVTITIPFALFYIQETVTEKFLGGRKGIFGGLWKFNVNLLPDIGWVDGAAWKFLLFHFLFLVVSVWFYVRMQKKRYLICGTAVRRFDKGEFHE